MSTETVLSNLIDGVDMQEQKLKFPFPKPISRQLRQCHVGVGFLYYNAGNETVTGAEFCIGRNDQMVYVQSGSPVTLELTDENQAVRRYRVRLEKSNN